MTHSMEDYLKNILQIERDSGQVRSVDIAAKMQVTKPSVHNALKVLIEEGLVTIGHGKRIFLTEKGREIAENINQRHSFFSKMLVGAGIPEDTARDEACQMEHSVSESTFRALEEKYSDKL